MERHLELRIGKCGNVEMGNVKCKSDEWLEMRCEQNFQVLN